MTHFVACRKIADASYVAMLFSKRVVKLHGVPKSIVSDRNVKFTSHYWKELSKWFGINFNFNITCHLQTEDQT